MYNCYMYMHTCTYAVRILGTCNEGIKIVLKRIGIFTIRLFGVKTNEYPINILPNSI